MRFYLVHFLIMLKQKRLVLRTVKNTILKAIMRSGLKNEREKSFPYQVLNRSPLEPKACVLTNELLFNFISKNVYWSSRYQLGNCLAKKIA